MKTRTRLTALFIGLLMIVALLPVFTMTALADTYEAEIIKEDGTTTQYATLAEAWPNIADKDTVKLLANCRAPQGGANRGAELSSAITVTLDLNGFVLRPSDKDRDGNATTTSRVLYVKKYTTLIIKDSAPTAEHWYYEDPNMAGLYVLCDTKDAAGIDAADYFMIPGGVITGADTGYLKDDKAEGGAIFVQGGKLVIEGGNIIGNKAVSKDWGKGAGAYVDQVDKVAGALVMTGGRIVGNVAKMANAWNLMGYHNNTTSSEYELWAESSVTGGTIGDAAIELLGNNSTIIPAGFILVENTETGWYDVEAAGEEKEEIKDDGTKIVHFMKPVNLGTPATCEEDGVSPNRMCTVEHEAGVVCTYADGGQVVPKLGHTPLTDPAVAPTCTKAGKTEGSHCTVCNKEIVAQEKVNALGHTGESWTVEKEATADEAGREIKYCTVCNEPFDMREIAALGAQTQAPAATQAPATTPAATEEKGGCSAVAGSAAAVLAVAVLGGCVICRKKED